MFEDKTLVCKDCGAEFIFSAGEQEFYAEKGFQNEPIRCKACRNALHLSRTMLTGGFAPAYVDRFACDWHRLSTTDPKRWYNFVYYIAPIQKVQAV